MAILILCSMMLTEKMIPSGRMNSYRETLKTKDWKMTNVMNNMEYSKDWTLDRIILDSWSTDKNTLVIWKADCHWETSKILNKRQKIKNGNRIDQFKIVHWNLGSRKWNKKLDEIELLCTEQRPDLCFISEANLWEGLDSHEYEIPGHQIILPNTMATNKHARIVLLVRDGIEVLKLNQYMSNDIATIWVQVGRNKKSIRVGGVYIGSTQYLV